MQERVLASAADRLAELEMIHRHAQQTVLRCEEQLLERSEGADTAHASAVRLNARVSELTLQAMNSEMSAEQVIRCCILKRFSCCTRFCF